MSFKLLVETIYYEDNKRTYTKEEQLIIEADLKKRTKSALKALGNVALDCLDRINDC